MIIINKEVLKLTQPCMDRWKNYLEYYSEFEGSFDEFLDLDKISHDDKIWVAREVLNRNQLVHFSVLCAESVLNIFQEKYPQDKRVIDCLSYMKTIVDFGSLNQEQRDHLYSLRKGLWASRNYAAYAAYAPNAAAYAATAYAADAGKMTKDEALEAQRKLNLQFLKMAASL